MPPIVPFSVFLLSTCSAAVLTPLAIWIGKRWGLVDVPGGRRMHKGRVVRIGGLALFPAFSAAMLLTFLLPVPRTDPMEASRLVGILLGMAVVWIAGIVDDWRELAPLPQLAGLVAAALIAIRFRVFIEVFNSPLGSRQIWVDWYLMLPITLAWIVGMSGTVNMLDGLDGLATGVTAVAALVLYVSARRLGQVSVSLLPLALLGCCLGFLPYNFFPAKIFLGGGAYYFGFALGTLSIVGGAKVAALLLVLWLPILDVGCQVYSRWQRGQPIGLGDRGHLHFRLLDRGWGHRTVVVLYYAITAFLGGVALLVSSRMLKLIVLVAVAVLVLGAMALLRQTAPRPRERGR